MKYVYVFDLDGTLADITHRLHHIQKEPKDWECFFAACSDDRPIPYMIEICRALNGNEPDNRGVVVVSGRSDIVRHQTETWLHQWGIYPTKIYMRKAGDHKPDHILKMELLADMRKDGYEPIMVFDDRAAVVKAWRAAGIPCAQVAEGEF